MFSPSLRRRGRVAIVSVGIVAGILAPATAPAQTQTAQPTATALACSWKVVASPSPGIGNAVLRGIDGVAARNLWAVGSKNAQGATLAEHWNGNKWSVVPTPNKGNFTQLEDVAAIRSDNVWAVGFYVPAGGSHQKTLIEHWNGRRWSIVPSPNPRSGNNILFGIDAVSGSNIWAVGGDNLDPSVGGKQITLRWNGSSWRSVAPLGVASGLQDVATVAASNVVGVGHLGAVGSSKPLIQKHNGASWTQLSTPDPGAGSDLQGVSARSATAQWAVGRRSGTAALQTMTMRNTGSGWELLPSPNSSTTLINVLHDVATVSANDAWAVGYHENSSFTRRTMAQHYSNGQWSIVPTPNPTSRSADLLGIKAVAGDLWAVGYSTNASFVTKTLIESRRC